MMTMIGAGIIDETDDDVKMINDFGMKYGNDDDDDDDGGDGDDGDDW